MKKLSYCLILMTLLPGANSFALETATPLPPNRVRVDSIAVIKDQNNELPSRAVRLDLEPISDASRYGIEIEPVESTETETLTFESTTNQLRFRLTPGKYRLRTRVVEVEKIGPWGEWSNFEVTFNIPQEVVPNDGSTLKSIAEKLEKVTLEWPQIPTALAYRLFVRNSSSQIVLDTTLKNTWYEIELPVRDSYTWAAIPIDRGDLLPENFVPKVWYSFAITVPEELLKPVKFQVDTIENAAQYTFEFVPLLANGSVGQPIVYNSKEPSHEIRLEPGKYLTRVRSTLADGSVTEWSTPSQFDVKMPQPLPLSPVDARIMKPNHDEKSEVLLRWKAASEVEKFRVRVYDETKKKLVDEVTSENQLYVYLPHNSAYSWSVVNHFDKEADRSIASVVDDGKEPREDFGISNYVKLALTSAEEPSQKYGWYRQITSVANYRSANNDLETEVILPIFGGTSEIAYGYWWQNSGDGILGTLGLSGFNIQNENYFFKAGSVLYAKRIKLNDGSRLRGWIGLGYKETPELIGDVFQRTFQFDRLQALGPEARLSYAREFNKEIGWHVFMTSFYSISTVKTPNNLAQKPELSYSIGLQGTFRVDDFTTALLGYTYQVDNAKYGSTRDSRENTISLAGHYLSLSLQFALEEAAY